MKWKNEIRKAQIVSVTVSLCQMHLTSADFFTSVIGFGGVVATMEIVFQHAVPLNFLPQNKIIIFVKQ